FTSDRLASDLNRTQAEMARLQSMISSGQRIQVPSDDPAGAALVLTIASRQAASTQFQRNLDAVTATLSSTDGALKSIVDDLTRAKERAVQGANDTNAATARQSLGNEVDQLLEGLVALGNSRGPDGGALFGGQETKADPYTVTRDVNGHITAVTPNARGIDGS